MANQVLILMRSLVRLCLLLIVSTAASAREPQAVETQIGVLGGASYRIDVPPNWNRELVVFYHGYSMHEVTFKQSDALAPQFKPLIERGYAVLQSGYSVIGWAIDQDYADTETLREFFAAKYGKPARSYVMGMSMGGTLTAMTVELKPKVYNGALSLCGVLEPGDRIGQREFALRAAFDYYFPDLLGSLVPVPKTFVPDPATVNKIAQALAAKSNAAQALLRWYGTGDARSLPSIIAEFTLHIRGLQLRARGNPFSNADLIYLNSGDDYALNDGVTRYRADPDAGAHLKGGYALNGVLTRPLLALHDTGDPLVPAASAFEYALALRRAGHAELFVQQYVNREGHCVFTPDEIAHAFDELVGWVRYGQRPPSGKLQ